MSGTRPAPGQRSGCVCACIHVKRGRPELLPKSACQKDTDNGIGAAHLPEPVRPTYELTLCRQGDEAIEDIGGPGVEWLAIIAACYENQ